MVTSLDSTVHKAKSGDGVTNDTWSHGHECGGRNTPYVSTQVKIDNGLFKIGLIRRMNQVYPPACGRNIDFTSQHRFDFINRRFDASERKTGRAEESKHLRFCHGDDHRSCRYSGRHFAYDIGESYSVPSQKTLVA